MRTTIDFPDDLFRQVKAKAALAGVSLKALIRSYVEQGLREGLALSAPAPRRRSELPVVRPSTGRTIPALTNEALQRLLDEEDAAHGRPG